MSEGTQSSDNQTLDTDSGEPSTEAVQGEKTAEQGTNLGWTFEDKNPFSAFSEEHLNKLDEVLQSDEVKELLQQSTSDLNLLNMDLGENGNQTSAAGVDTDPATDEIPESIMSAVFSDHGYCLNPGAQKAKSPGDNTPKAKPIMVSLDEEGNISPSIDIAASLLSPAVTRVIAKKESPYVNSPRKSGRAPTRNRMFDEEWVTESPGRSRGRGKTDQGSSPGFGKRASTRISDQKQRDLAEKILQANRQAMEAEKQADPLLGKGRGRGRIDGDEVPSPGQGKKEEEVEEGEKEEEINNEEQEKEEEEEGEISPKKSPKKKVPVNKKGKRYEDDSDFSDDEKIDTTKKKKAVIKKGQKDEEGEESEEEKDAKQKKGKKGQKDEEGEDSGEEANETKKKKGVKVKKGEKAEDSEESGEEEKDAKKKKGKKGKKGQKQKEGEESEDSEEEEKDATRKKGKKGLKQKEGEESEDSEEEEKDATRKKGKKGLKQKEGEESVNSEVEEKDATKKKGKKGKLALKTKKKVKLKGKKLKKEKKQADSVEENSDKEKTEDESVTLPSKTKGLKKLSKKERLKKLKEAKEAKKAKLLAKKKAKNAAKLKKKGKDTDAESTDTGTSPVKKKLRGREATNASDMSPSPTKKKVKGKDTDAESTDTGISPVKKKLRGKETLDSPGVISSLAKKKLKGKEEMGKKKKGVSADEKSPLKKKAKLGAASDAESPGKIKGLSPKGNKKGQNESKSPVQAGKRKEADDSQKSDSPLKKQKLGKKGKKQVKSKREVSDSEDDTPLKKVKTSLTGDAKKSSQSEGINKPADQKTSNKKQNSDLNIFSAFSDSVHNIGSATKTDEGMDSKSSKSESIRDDLNDKKSKSQSTIKESKESNTDKTENKSSKVSSVVKTKGISVSKESESTNKADRVLDKRKDVVDKEVGGEKRPDKPSEGKESHKRHDSNDSKDSKDGKHSHHHHHHHHHHRHHSSSSSSSRRHSHDRRESDDIRKDSTSSGSSHRKESTERRHSHDKKDGHDRKGSSKDRRDSSSSSSKDRKDRDRHDSRTDKDRPGSKGSAKLERKDSTSSITTPGKNQSGFDKNKLGSSGKKIGKDGKKVKKLKKEDLPMDQSMVDLFKPDNMPDAPKEEIAVEKVEEEKVVVVVEKSMRVRFSDEVDIRIDDKQESKDTSVFEDEIDVSKVEQTDPVKEMNEFEIKDNKHEADEEVDDKDIKMENKEKDSVDQKLEEVKSDNVEVDSGKADHVTTNEIDQTEKKSDIVADVTANKIDQTENKSDSIENEKSKSVDIDETGSSKDDLTEVVIDVLHVEDKSNTNESETVKNDESLAKDKSEEVKGVSDEPDLPDKNETANGSEDIERDVGNKVSNNVSNNDTKDDVESKPVEQDAIPAEITSPKVRKTFQISDFFKEKRLKINDPKPRKPKVVSVPVKELPVATASPDTPTRQSARRNKGVAFAEIMKKEKLGSDEEEEEEEEEQQEPYKDDENDEDFEDPDQLYCICRQPHNQRFMICCDSCEEWFHGKCVGITRAQGEEMEKNEEEYVCPTCLNKDSQVSTTDTDQPKEMSEDGTSVFEAVTSPDSTEGSASSGSYKQVMQDDKEISSTVRTPTKQKPAKPPSSDTKTTAQQQRKKELTLSEKRDRVIKMFKDGDSPKSDKTKITICVQCSVRPVKPGTKFCSGHCQTKYGVKDGQKPVGILKVSYSKDKEMDKKNKEKHIAVVEKSTGKTFTGDKAPRESELKEWLENHPTFEVLKVHKKPTPTKQADEKSKSQHGKSVKSEEPDVRHEGPEPVRLNVRKGLRDALAARANAADDIMLSNSEIKGLALGIEKELNHYFKDTDSKYKAKYRSLVFNIKDVKNKGLFRKILNGRIRPSKLVRMSADELASKELAQWREQETKHTIELIKQVETDLLKDPVQVTKKTHKGEVEVEGEGGVDMSTLVQEAKKEVTKGEEKGDLLGDLLPDTTDGHGHHLFDSNCKICTGKVVPGLSDTTPSTKVQTEITPKVQEEEQNLTKQEKDLQAEEVVKEVLKAIQRAKEEATRDERESKLGSAVTVRSPDSALSSGLDKKEKFTPSGPMLWKGFIYMQDVSKFVTSAYIITGPSDHMVLPDTITVCGRINPEHVWDYLSKVKQAASRDISVVRFIPGVNEEKVAYINLYSYLNSRSRCGVVEHKAKHIKDFYVVPLASHSKIPSVLKPFDGPGLEENRCHMLIGVIIRNKGKSSSDSSSSSSSHSSRHKKESKPLKSALKDPTKKPSKKKAEISEPVESAGNTPDKSSSSSTPKTSSSTSTPQEKKATTISFDPIVKEYSTVSEQEEPYTPGGVDDPLDPNAPYDPEKEAVLKTAVKKEKAKPDAVSIMIEKIALSKNPAEATAAMVTALATTSRLGNQRKLLVELTKKVDEQKRLLEQKRGGSKASKSPPASGSSPGQGTSSSDKSQKGDKKKGLSSKDPRLRAMAASAAKSKETPAEEAPVVTEPMDVDMRLPPPHGGAAGTSVTPGGAGSSVVTGGADTSAILSVPGTSVVPGGAGSNVIPVGSADSIVPGAPADPRLKPPNPFDSISSNASAILGSLATLAGVKNIMTKTDLKEKESVAMPIGFYLDQEQKETEVKASDKPAVIGISLASVKGKEGAEKALITDVNTNKQTVVASTKPSDEGNKDITAINVESLPQTEVTSKLNKDEPPANKEINNGQDSVTDNKKVTTDLEGASLVSQIQAEVQGPKVSKPEVPNVAALLKGLGSSAASSSAQALVGQKLLQLPTALMSLFSKLPNQSSAASETEKPPVVADSKTPAPAETPSEPQDVDLRGQSSGKPTPAGFKSTFIEVGNKSETTETKITSPDKTDKDKPSKSFMGFDYDSASDSDGSFEGFEDDGTRVLSPRRRKPAVKGKVLNQPPSQIGMTNEMGDIDVRNAMVEDVDLRKLAEPEIADKDMRREPPNLDTDHRLGSANLDIDQRLGSARPPHSDPYPRLPTTEVTSTPPPTMVLDVDHRRHPFPPPPRLGLQFMPPGGQPPPPGEEWNISQSVPPPLPPGMGQLHPPLMAQQPPSLNPPPPPLPSEPPAPKPPEPPMKKDKKNKDMESEHTDKDSNGFGKKTPMLQSDARLQKIVLELAKKEPIDPPPIPPSGLRSRMHHSQRRFSRPPMPMSTQGMMPHGPPPMQNLRMPWTEAMIGSTGWMPGPPPPGTMLNAQSQMMPPQLPLNMQPGVCFPPHPPPPSQPNPPSLLDIPVGGNPTSSAQTVVTETSGMPAEIDTDKEVHPPHSQESDEGGSQSRNSRNDSRNRDQDDRDDRRRRDRDRDRERRSRSGDSSDRKSHDHSRGHSHDRDRSRSERDRDRNRDRDRDRERDRRSRDRDYDRDRRYSKHRH